MNNTKTIFFGSGPYALISLKSLLQSKLPIISIVTKVTSPDIIKLAREEQIDLVIYDGKWKEISEKLKTSDVALVASFSVKIPGRILKIPRLGFFNIHPSLLPRHRGPSPVVSEILAGDEFGGVTIYKMDNRMDHGPILGFKKEKNDKNKLAGQIYEERFLMGAELFLDLLPNLGSAKLTEQDHKKASYSSILSKQDGYIDLNLKYSPILIYNMVRAYHPWPGVYFNWTNPKGKELRINIIGSAVYELSNTQVTFDDLLVVHEGHLLLTNTDQDNTYLEIIKLQMAGKGIILAKQFINGYLK